MTNILCPVLCFREILAQTHNGGLFSAHWILAKIIHCAWRAKRGVWVVGKHGAAQANWPPEQTTTKSDSPPWEVVGKWIFFSTHYAPAFPLLLHCNCTTFNYRPLCKNHLPAQVRATQFHICLKKGQKKRPSLSFHFQMDTDRYIGWLNLLQAIITCSTMLVLVQLLEE